MHISSISSNEGKLAAETSLTFVMLEGPDRAV